MSQLGIPKMRQTFEFLWHEPATVRSGHLPSQSRGTWTDTRSTGPREALYGLIPGWHEAKHTFMDMRTDSTAVPHAGLSENLRNQDRCQ